MFRALETLIASLILFGLVIASLALFGVVIGAAAIAALS